MNMKEPPLFREPGADISRGATLEEAESLVAMLRQMGKARAGKLSGLVLAAAVVLVDEFPPEAIEGEVGKLADVLRQCVAHVERRRAEGPPS